MSRADERMSEEMLARREPTYDACTVCGEPFDGVSESPYCSPACGRSQQL